MKRDVTLSFVPGFAHSHVADVWTSSWRVITSGRLYCDAPSHQQRILSGHDNTTRPQSAKAPCCTQQLLHDSAQAEEKPRQPAVRTSDFPDCVV